MIHIARHIATAIDTTNTFIGRSAAWLVLLMVLVQFGVVIMRYVFGEGSIIAQEAILYMHATLFLVAAADTLLQDAHVKIDIFYARLEARQQHLINIIGYICFAIPFCVLIWVVSFEYVALSWKVLEGSRETSGIPAIYLLKSVILIFAVQLGLQSFSQIIKSFIGWRQNV
ncbi:MAG: TRAP transporter small permease subunit [Alphaproteobacteria bacterium]|nr:TRAP transporter small permease subunit [Alphaproteobacteria bacterium]MBE8220883.1 TRAP transporter small permease subunit [Alphaproteobacteria bacterium]